MRKPLRIGDLWSRAARSLAGAEILRGGHVHDLAPVEALERQKRSDERTVRASHVMDVAPENVSTTSRHAERSDVVDALRGLQRIGVMGEPAKCGLASPVRFPYDDVPFRTVRVLSLMS